MNIEIFLQRHPIFGALPATLTAGLAAGSRVRDLAPGELLCREGEDAATLYVLLSGRIDVERDGRGPVASLGRRGDLMGEMSILTGQPRSATLRAELESRVLEIPASGFRDLLERAPHLGLPLAQILSQRLSGAATRDTRRKAYVGLLVAGRVRATIAKNLAAALPGRVLAHDLEAAAEKPELLATLSTIPIEKQEEFIRGLSTDAGLVGSIPERMLGYFLGMLRESFDRVVFGIPFPFYRPQHREVARACDVLVVLCAPDIPADSEIDKLRALERPMIFARLRGRSRIPVEGADVPLDDVGEIAPVARKLLSKTVGLALGSGAARGYAHIGVLEVLERERVPVDFVAGTSMGSLIGGLYASGRTTAELRAIAKDASRAREIWSLLDLAIPRVGLLRGRRVANYYKRLFGDARIEDLPRPFRAVAADVGTGREIVFDRGPVWRAVRASTSIPAVFEPVREDGRLLVDGGVVNPIPVSHALELGADRTIAVNVTSGPAEDPNPGIFSILMGSIYTLQTLVAESRSSLADVTIVPEFAGLRWTDFGRAEEMIAAGRAAAERAMPAIRKMLG